MSSFLKKVGDPVKKDETIAEIETDKVVMEVVAPVNGALTEVLKQEGDTVLSQELLGMFEEGAGAAASAAEAPQVSATAAAEPSGDEASDVEHDAAPDRRAYARVAREAAQHEAIAGQEMEGGAVDVEAHEAALSGSDRLLAELRARGAVAALGHTRASPAEIREGIARGLGHVTHLFNAMGPMHHRDPGVPGTVLASDELSCDLICDGHHVDPAMGRMSRLLKQGRAPSEIVRLGVPKR